MLQIAQSTVENGLLSRWPESEFQSILPILDPFERVYRSIIYEPNMPPEHAYLPVSGIGPVIAITPANEHAETGTIGREGFLGSPIALGVDYGPFKVVVQSKGRSLRMPRNRVLEALAGLPTFRQLLLRFIHIFNMQTAQTAVVNGHNTLPQRLARWLVMCFDRVDGIELHLTHEFLSIMLAVRQA